MAFGNPAATLGFVGFVRFVVPGAGDGGLVRATSADIHLAQEITAPDVVDSRFDRTVVQLGPKIVEGTVEFPAIFRRGSSDVTIAEELYTKAVKRNSQGRLTEIPIEMKYTSGPASFTYKDCIVDTWTYSVTQSDMVNISTGIIGNEREAEGGNENGGGFQEPSGIDNTRIVLWSDAIVEAKLTTNTTEVTTITGDFVRSFECTIANNAERFYTVNGLLAPQDIAPTKRDVTGTLTFMGRIASIGLHAETNEERCIDESTVVFGYDVSEGLSAGAGCGGAFLRRFPNVWFQIEEMALTNDLFETTINFRSFPAASTATRPNGDPDDPLLDEAPF